MQKIYGAMTALITPFKNGKVDEEGYAKLIKRQIKNGIDAIVPVGTTGESATLTHDEHKQCIEIAVDIAKKEGAKVVAGAGSNSTKEAIDLATFAQKAGADAILCVCPYYNKPTQEGIYLHYKAIANSIDIPLMLYNVPGRTSVDIKPQTVKRLFEEVENIYAIKEATGSLERTIELVKNSPDLIVISGDDSINFGLIANGAKGTISVTANLLPDLVKELVKSALEGDFQKAMQINLELFDINKTMFIESNPIPIKAAMFIAGLIDSLEYRLPLAPPSKESMKKIANEMKKFDIKGF